MKRSDLPVIDKNMKWLEMADAHNDANIDNIAVVVRYKSGPGKGDDFMQIELLPGTPSYDAVVAQLASFITAKRADVQTRLNALIAK